MCRHDAGHTVQRRIFGGACRSGKAKQLQQCSCLYSCSLTSKILCIIRAECKVLVLKHVAHFPANRISQRSKFAVNERCKSSLKFRFSIALCAAPRVSFSIARASLTCLDPPMIRYDLPDGAVDPLNQIIHDSHFRSSWSLQLFLHCCERKSRNHFYAFNLFDN